MIARRTSAEAYRRLVEEGGLSKRRAEVYGLVYKFGPGTSAEILAHALTGIAVLTQSRARFTELRALGLIAEVGTRTCSVTGRESICWDCTERAVPLERPGKAKRPSEVAALEERLAQVEARLRALDGRLL